MLTLKRYLPHIVVAFAIAGIMVGAYVAVAFSASYVPKATWLINPLPINFQATGGRGGGVDSVTCNRAASGLIFRVHSSRPSSLSIALSPSTFSCNSAPSIITITATCLASTAECRGSYQGIVQIRQPANYRDIPESLRIDIAVS